MDKKTEVETRYNDSGVEKNTWFHRLGGFVFLGLSIVVLLPYTIAGYLVKRVLNVFKKRKNEKRNR